MTNSGFELWEVPYGKLKGTRYVVADPYDSEDGFYLECLTYAEAFTELQEHLEFITDCS